MKVCALIVEDELLARETLRDFASQITWLDLVGEAADGATAVQMIDNLRPELVFLDVQMPVFSGLRLLELIKHQPFVVFTTAFDDYAIPAFELGALDYLLKPFGIERFLKSLDRIKIHFSIKETPGTIPTAGERVATVMEKSPREPLTRLFVNDSRGRIVPIQTENILRIKAADDYVEIHLKDKYYLIHITLNDFERRLDPARFRRVHRSHIVNLEHVKAFETYDRRLLLRLSDGSEVIASREGAKNLRSLLC